MIARPSLHWVDNNQLLFVGINRAEMEAAIAAKERDRVRRLRKLYLWNSASQSARLYADASDACFSDGFISYTTHIDRVAGKQVLREGPFGLEKEIQKGMPPKEALYSSFTCRAYLRTELTPPAPPFRHVVVLRNGDGYLDLGPGGGPNYFEERRRAAKNIVLYQANGTATQLPLTWDENFSSTEVAFSRYRRAYVLRPRVPRGTPVGATGPWPKGRPFLMYLVHPNGSVESVSIPYFETAGLAHPRPIQTGWIFGGSYSTASGLYLFDGRAISELEVGAVKEIAVSPDGCKSAVAIQNRHLDMGTPTNLRIFDACGGRN